MAILTPTEQAAAKLAGLLPADGISLSDESYRLFYFHTQDLATVQRTMGHTWKSYKGWEWQDNRAVSMDDVIRDLALARKDKPFPSDSNLMEQLCSFYRLGAEKVPFVIYLENASFKSTKPEPIASRVLSAYISYCARVHRRQLDEQDQKKRPYDPSQDGFPLHNRIFFAFYGTQCEIPEKLKPYTADIYYPSLTKKDLHQLLLEYSLRTMGIPDVEAAEEPQKKKLDVLTNDIDDWYANRVAGLEEVEVRRLLGTISKRAGVSFADKGVAEWVINDYKNRLILQHDRLKVIGESAQEVAGLENIKDWLKEHKSAMGDYECAPTGILLVGIPGTGKSATAKEAAQILDMPLVQLDMSKILGGRVGDSEKGMREMLEDLKFLAPCVLWIDEIEKALSGADGKSGDGGVVQRLFGMLLTFIQENKRPVFTVTTANDISKLPPEFFRNGRFDQTFCLMMPSYAECLDIMKLKLNEKYFKRLGWEPCKDEISERLLEACLGTPEAPRFLTGADIEAHAQELYWSCNKKYTKRPSDDKLVEEMGKVAKTVRAQATPSASHTMEDIARRYVYMMRRGMTMAGKSDSVYTADCLDLDKVIYYSYEDDSQKKALPGCMKEPNEFEPYKEITKCLEKPASEWYDARFFYELDKAMSKVVATDEDLSFRETMQEYIKLQRHINQKK